ncbi:hypothetical protein IMZ48_19195 [Candidatus Bathyarchaeota archaeon]|nr:hypothetical protein [Candidatus Bathyarchaeota archaeon]
MRRDREDIRQQFRELEPAVLLFVRNLRRIDVIFYDEHGQQDWATRLSRRLSEQPNRVTLERRVAGAEDLEDVVPESHFYYFTKYMASDVAQHEGRDPYGMAGPASRQSKIVLAFPVTEQSVPVIEPQKVFAFLPMKKMGFNVSLGVPHRTKRATEIGLTGVYSSSYKRTLSHRPTGRTS